MSDISINIKNMLWSTRGKEWGFRFVNQPEDYPDLSGQIYNSIFIKDDRVPLRCYGTASLPNGNVINYVASRFFDPDTTWKDIASRQIPHEIYLDIGVMPPKVLISCFWEYAVMNQLRNYYSVAYNKSAETIQPFQGLGDEILLSCTPCPIEASRVDIQLSSQKIDQRNISIGGKVWKVLNSDLSELLP